MDFTRVCQAPSVCATTTPMNARKEVNCYHCGRRGHLARECYRLKSAQNNSNVSRIPKNGNFGGKS